MHACMQAEHNKSNQISHLCEKIFTPFEDTVIYRKSMLLAQLHVHCMLRGQRDEGRFQKQSSSLSATNYSHGRPINEPHLGSSSCMQKCVGHNFCPPFKYNYEPVNQGSPGELVYMLCEVILHGKRFGQYQTTSAVLQLGDMQDLKLSPSTTTQLFASGYM